LQIFPLYLVLVIPKPGDRERAHASRHEWEEAGKSGRERASENNRERKIGEETKTEKERNFCMCYMRFFLNNSMCKQAFYNSRVGSDNACKRCINRLQHTATLCNTLQHTTTHFNTLQHTVTNCNTLQHAVTHCNTLQQIIWYQTVCVCVCVLFPI